MLLPNPPDDQFKNATGRELSEPEKYADRQADGALKTGLGLPIYDGRGKTKSRAVK